MKKFVKAFVLAALVVAVVAPSAFAALGNGYGTVPNSVPGDPGYVNAGPGTVYSILDNVISIAFYILMFLAILFILFAAFRYLTAQGNPENVETAQRMLLYAVIAIVIGLLARSIPWIISQFVTKNVVTGQ